MVILMMTAMMKYACDAAACVAWRCVDGDGDDAGSTIEAANVSDFLLVVPGATKK
jgi:hypothetical protein